MVTHKISKSYKTKYPNPIELDIGDVVILGEEEEEEKWKGWIWVESKTNKGWVPIQIIEFMHKKKGILKEKYSAKELNVKTGEKIMKIQSLHGWTWVKKVDSNEEGWIPDEVIE